MPQVRTIARDTSYPLGRPAFRAALTVLLLAISPALASAARPCTCCPGGSAAAGSKLAWQILETPNFRVLSYTHHLPSAEVGEACEALRAELCGKWLGDEAPTWTPKCDVVLHPNDDSYLREVGSGGSATVASSLVDHRHGAIRLRRIDVRYSDSGWQRAALPHELTHVILADRFGGRTLPRWIDEGLAILADPADKRSRHLAEFDSAVARRSTFRVVELMQMRDYPAADRWGTFYGQSLSLVEFLVAQRTPAEFVEFAQLALEDGYEAGLREVYGYRGVGDLERQWLAAATAHRAPASRTKQQVAAASAGSIPPTRQASVRPR